MLKEKWRGLSGNVKRVILGIGALFFLILIIGAGIYLDVPRRIRLWHPTEQVIREDVTQYLKERYGEEFVITNVLPPGYNYASYIITAYPSGASQDYEHKVTIQGWEKRGLITYYDNYPIVKLIPELNQYISDVVSDYSLENKIYVDFYKEWYSENIEKNLSVDALLENKEHPWHSSLWCYICLPYKGETDTELVNKINNLVAGLGINNLSGIFLVVVMKREIFDSLTNDINGTYWGENGRDFWDFDFYVKENGEFDKITEVK